VGNKWIFVAGLACAGAAIAVQTGKQTSYSKHYRENGASIELIGVCRATETEVECWNEDGGPNPELQEEFKNSFAFRSHQSIPIKYGQKTRVAFFKVTNPPYNDPRGNVSSHFQDVSNNWDLPRSESSSREGDNRVEYRGAVLITKLNETTGTVRSTRTRSSLPSPRMAMKEGSSCNYLNAKFTIRKTVKGSVDPSYPYFQGQRWMIAMTSETSEAQNIPLNWTAIGHDGLVIRTVDKVGNPVLIDPATLQQGMMGQRPVPEVPKYFAAQLTTAYSYAPRMGDDYSMFTNINPAKIKEIYAVGNITERIDITDIPLEPKR